ncbi:lipopolysaccharide biosynthesis protein [Actibacterium lipolyticum]|uniref:Inner membrane protein YghQ n=1 Tax=Actibacterium lipolyticum TaxID=1524263 RepID=A0A238KX89_9RHOB|nr:oligosaccharide flippase family protein [Actibacterium lipolyticum]SMX47308.1 Inner membrane protein YghQ [Actibacterium lipolyticum]
MSMFERFKADLTGDAVFNRVLKNMSWLFSAHIMIAALGLISLAVTARALGPAGLGILAIVESYVRIVDRLLRLEPWQAVIKYGVDALEREEKGRFHRLIKLSILIDLAGGFLAGSVAIALAWFIAPRLGLPDDGFKYICLVALALFLSLRPTGIAVLRIYDRFDKLAKLDVFVAVLRLVLCVLAYWFDLGIWAFLAILLVQSLADGILAFVYALIELTKRGDHHIMRTRARDAISENLGFLRFLWNSNFNVILRQSSQRFDVIILAALVDPAAVGFFHVAKRTANAALRFGRPLRQAIYPEIARIWARGEVARFARVVTRTSTLVFLVAFVCFVPIALNLPAILATFLGEEFRDAASLVTVQALAVIVYLSGIILNPTLLSMGKDKELVRITIIATIAFFALFVPLVKTFGATGAAISHLLFNLIWMAGCLVFLWRESQRRRANKVSDV